MSTTLPFSAACERNREPILEVLRQYPLSGDLLEMGHGTGQHAVYFSTKLPVTWFPSDLEENRPIMIGRRQELSEHDQLRCRPPLTLEVGNGTLLEQLGRTFDHFYTANTLHIMSEANAYRFCDEVGEVVKPNGYLFLYGPFLYDGRHTSDSNRQFDEQLRSTSLDRGLREFNHLKERLAGQFHHYARHDLPANNQLHVFLKKDE